MLFPQEECIRKLGQLDNCRDNEEVGFQNSFQTHLKSPCRGRRGFDAGSKQKRTPSPKFHSRPVNGYKVEAKGNPKLQGSRDNESAGKLHVDCPHKLGPEKQLQARLASHPQPGQKKEFQEGQDLIQRTWQKISCRSRIHKSLTGKCTRMVRQARIRIGELRIFQQTDKGQIGVFRIIRQARVRIQNLEQSGKVQITGDQAGYMQKQHRGTNEPNNGP